ncbi:PilZ domain-containing protein [Aliidiomarina minuta]|nr:PilZ domain-containing protein [Aliidiomarina minuta]
MIVDKENRNFYRMMLDAEAEVQIGDESLTGICKDLSATGLALELNHELDMGQVIGVTIKGGTVQSLSMQVKVLRVERLNENRLVYGCEVVSMN